MKKFFLVLLTVLVLIAAGGWYLWQNQIAPSSISNADPGFYTIGTVGAHIKVPDDWTYSTNEAQDFAAFQSPDFMAADGSTDPFTSSPIVQGAVIIIPLFLFEEDEPLPVGELVSLGGEEGDIAHGATNQGEGVPETEYDRLRLNIDGVRYVLLALEYPSGFEHASSILGDVVSNFEFR